MKARTGNRNALGGMNRASVPGSTSTSYGQTVWRNPLLETGASTGWIVK